MNESEVKLSDVTVYDDRYDGLELWDRVASTPEERTKKVNIRGGFTAINPQFQLQQATELWGPYGGEWGLNGLDYTFINDGQGIMLEAMFYVTTADIMFPIAVDMLYRPGDDCCKKLLTSARSKALSYLGFGADIFLGQYEDAEYMTMNRIKFGDKTAFQEKFFQQIDSVKDFEALKAAEKKLTEMVQDDIISEHEAGPILDKVGERRLELKIQ